MSMRPDRRRSAKVAADIAVAVAVEAASAAVVAVLPVVAVAAKVVSAVAAKADSLEVAVVVAVVVAVAAIDKTGTVRKAFMILWAGRNGEFCRPLSLLRPLRVAGLALSGFTLQTCFDVGN